MNRPTRIAFGVIAAAMFAWMLVLFTRSATIVEANSNGPDVTVDCGTIVAAGWPFDHSELDTETSGTDSDHVPSGTSLSPAAFDGIARDCADRRDTYLGTMALLAVPTTLLAAGAFFAGRRREPA